MLINSLQHRQLKIINWAVGGSLPAALGRRRRPRVASRRGAASETLIVAAASPVHVHLERGTHRVYSIATSLVFDRVTLSCARCRYDVRDEGEDGRDFIMRASVRKIFAE